MATATLSDELIFKYLVFIQNGLLSDVVVRDILFGQQVDGHVVYWIYGFLQYQVFAQRLDGVISLQTSVLGNKELNAAFL